MKHFSIRLTLLLLIVFIVGGSIVAQEEDPLEVRIGYQRGSLFNVPEIRERLESLLEERLGRPIILTLDLFPSGPPLLEAINAGSIDIGSVGDTPPIFAQAAGVPFVYIASQITTGGSAILVQQDSPIQSVADLAGKTVAYVSGSSSNFFIIQALRLYDLDYEDIEPAFLAPGDARAAFESGSIDAWVIWDPFLTIAVAGGNARTIITSADLPITRNYHLASSDFAEQYPEAVEIILDVYQEALDWAQEDEEGYAQYLFEETTVPVDIWYAVFETRPISSLEYITPEIVDSQQEIADIFTELEIIPSALDVNEVIWTPEWFDPETVDADADEPLEGEEVEAEEGN
jgi:sulfonate transport system substrate-binding protein